MGTPLDAAKLVGSVMGAATDVITRVVELVGKGKVDRAKEVVDHFVATTKTQLTNDRGEAEAILEDRLGSQR